jgi:hypothetical protein
MARLRIAGWAAAALLFAGCGGSTTRTAHSTTTVQPTSTTAAATTTLPATTTAQPSVTRAATPATTALSPLVLDADGLGSVAFGTPKDVATTVLITALGAPERTGKGCELAGPDVTTAGWRDLTVQFVNGKLTSYTVRPVAGSTASLGLATKAGIKLGSTVAALKTAYGDRLKIPGLPREFGGEDFAVSFPGSTNAVYGSLTATSNDGLVTSIFTSVCE